MHDVMCPRAINFSNTRGTRGLSLQAYTLKEPSPTCSNQTSIMQSDEPSLRHGLRVGPIGRASVVVVGEQVVGHVLQPKSGEVHEEKVHVAQRRAQRRDLLLEAVHDVLRALGRILALHVARRAGRHAAQALEQLPARVEEGVRT